MRDVVEAGCLYESVDGLCRPSTVLLCWDGGRWFEATEYGDEPLRATGHTRIKGWGPLDGVALILKPEHNGAYIVPVANLGE